MKKSTLNIKHSTLKFIWTNHLNDIRKKLANTNFGQNFKATNLNSIT